MLLPQTPNPALDRSLVAIDLIGELDGRLGEILDEALADVAARGDFHVVVNFDFVSAVHADGIRAAGKAIVAAKVRGENVSASVSPRNRRMRSVLKDARVTVFEPGATKSPTGARRIMIARSVPR
ncbi:MAG: hypothetical protein GIW95_08370 [Candidatus Eremiobacteraeota bacterium]|nr:hypothetical protein [Candidatus Eremiobacteraeota bacterium]